MKTESEGDGLDKTCLSFCAEMGCVRGVVLVPSYKTSLRQ